jgi:aspartate racemase
VNKTIIIGGGVGPMAGVDLHRRIIAQTETNGTDQDHLRVLHASFSDLIPDRTESLSDGTARKTGEAMARILLACEKAARSFGGGCVAGVPCNTFHARPIWDACVELLRRSDSDMELVSMIDETAAYLSLSEPQGSAVGVLATTGTRDTGLYDRRLAEIGLEVCYPQDQDRVHQSIYDPSWGIKARWPVTEKSVNLLERALDELHDQGARTVLLACTELPLALTQSTYRGMRLVNPVDLLARRLIESAAPGRVKDQT